VVSTVGSRACLRNTSMILCLRMPVSHVRSDERPEKRSDFSTRPAASPERHRRHGSRRAAGAAHTGTGTRGTERRWVGVDLSLMARNLNALHSQNKSIDACQQRPADEALEIVLRVPILCS
jgi:hypothetical protein